MPKMKTKKIAVKRFKVTKNGKVLHRVQGRRHLRKNKSQSCKRRQDRPAQLKTNKHKQIIRRLMAL